MEYKIHVISTAHWSRPTRELCSSWQALLRPGRLDRQLYCGFPDEVEREDILRAVSIGTFKTRRGLFIGIYFGLDFFGTNLVWERPHVFTYIRAPGSPSLLSFPNDAHLEVSRKTPMTEEARTVALVRIARSSKAAGFTGADLQAVVDAAQLAAIHGYLDVRVNGLLHSLSSILDLVQSASYGLEFDRLRPFCTGPLLTALFAVHSTFYYNCLIDFFRSTAKPANVYNGCSGDTIR